MKKEQVRAGVLRQLANSGKMLFALVCALLLGSLLLVALGYSPVEVYLVMLEKAFGSFDSVLRRATILMLSGLAVAIPMKSGMLNMGGEGQVLFGALISAIVGSAELGLPAGVHMLVAIVAAAATGVFLAAIPAALSIYRGASEVVVCIMMNSILTLVGTWLIMNPFKGSLYEPKTPDVLPSARIPGFGVGVDASFGIFASLLLCVLAWVFLERSPRGLALKSSGLNATTARYQGINTKTMGMLGMLLGGAMAATGGAFEVLGGRLHVMDGYFLNFGYDGVAIAIMARNNPLGIIFSSIFVSMIRIGSLVISRKTGLSTYYVTVLQGFIIALLVVPYLAEMVFGGVGKLLRRRGKKGDAV